MSSVLLYFRGLEYRSQSISSLVYRAQKVSTFVNEYVSIGIDFFPWSYPIYLLLCGRPRPALSDIIKVSSGSGVPFLFPFFASLAPSAILLDSRVLYETWGIVVGFCTAIGLLAQIE